jgi:hypothetical protein
MDHTHGRHDDMAQAVALAAYHLMVDVTWLPEPVVMYGAGRDTRFGGRR